MHPLFLFIPNIFAYLRIILMIIVIYKLPTSPLASFIFTLTSGLLDGIDGNFARYLHQTSKVGMLFDISIDRFTNLAQMFFLTRIFPKYCTIFLFVGFMELARDLVYWVYAYYSILMIVFNQIYINKNSSIESFRENLYEYLFFNKKPTSNIIIRPHGYFVHEFVYPLIWYSSDLFYWIIFIAGFNLKKQHGIKSISLINNNTNGTCSSSSSSSSRDSSIDSPKESFIDFDNTNQDDILINNGYTPLNVVIECDSPQMTDNNNINNNNSSIRDFKRKIII